MKSTFPIVVSCIVCAWTSSASGHESPIAQYRFDEGRGTVLHDSSAGSSHGEIRGATWVPCGDGFALEFDGVDDYVDFGTPSILNPSKAVSVEAWVYPKAVPASGEPGVVGKCYGSYVLTYYTDGQFWWYIAGGGNHCTAPATTGDWCHLVGTFDGKLLKLYVDGGLAAEAKSEVATIPSGGAVRLGTSSGESNYTKGIYFKGMITEVRIYDRALSAEEVASQYRTTRLTNRIEIRSYLSIGSGTVDVDMDLRALGELPSGACVVAELFQPGGTKPLQTCRVAPSRSGTMVEAALKVGDLAPGEYELRAAVIGGDGRRIGRVSTSRIAWPARPRWKDAPTLKVLNNLVTELLDVASPPGGAEAVFPVVNPREGWVFISFTARADTDDPPGVVLDGQQIHTRRQPGTLEAMRFLSKGPHEVRVTSPAGLERLVVRAVPELVYSVFGADPHVHEYGKYDWDFLSKHVLPNINVLVVTANKEQEPFIRQWKRQGRRCLVECGVPGLSGDNPVTADEAEEFWSSQPGMTDPLMDGVLADEFFGEESEKYAAWTEAVRRMRADDRFKEKHFYPYCAPMYGAEDSREFIQAVMDAGWRFAFERYLPEQRSKRAARAYLDAALRQQIAAWCEAMPGAERHMIVCMGTFSQPPESLDVNPATNYKVFLDMQLNLLANDPACFGLYGVMTYLSSYTDEETVRWMGRLFRHYCIEGKTEPLSRDPFVLPHLRNGDFEDGTRGWNVEGAGADSVAAKKKSGFSWLQGRYPKTSQGDTVLWMKRSGRHPNLVSQTVKDLQPGRLYSLRMYSGDYRDLSAKSEHAVSIELGGVELIEDKCFRHVFANCYSHRHGPFDRENRAWMNYHWLIFRAKSKEAVLKISDWSSPDKPGGPVGQELMMNFIQIQPYDQ